MSDRFYAAALAAAETSAGTGKYVVYTAARAAVLAAEMHDAQNGFNRYTDEDIDKIEAAAYSRGYDRGWGDGAGACACE